MTKRLLLIDDEPAIQLALAPVLRADGWTVSQARSAAEALACAAREAIDIVLLDLGLPDADGKEIIPSLRASERAAVIVLSARHQESEKVAALDAGADDYVDKPFNMDVLRARIRAAERRLRSERTTSPRYVAGSLELDTKTREVLLEGHPVKFSPKEFELLKALIEHAGQVVTHRQLLIAGWETPAIDQQYLRGYIALIRQKLEEDPSEPRMILSEPGVGYRLAV
ncbi:MAG TPA: response regulator transcription factor [Sphingomicrobium sp.]|jgi:two-component system KDP operon response regulator KdpE|nr:response regulator transcription factor [Sphingomicrobium sp.]